ncbi:MAG: MATE family efflux transporter [Treponema sp.]|nr:MATE family efflux transporter [Treponema sp.]
MVTEDKESETIILSEKEERKRQMILSGSKLKIILLIALPLVFYNSLNQIFQLIDTIIASNLSAKVVSTVSFVAQIESMILAIGSALALGGGVIISRSYGEGDMNKVKTQISTLFFLCIFIGAGILAVIIPLAYPFLKLLKMPEDLIGTGTAYFSFDVISIIFQFINTIYFATLKSRGNTKQVMYGNTLVLFIKTALNVSISVSAQRGLFDADKAMLLLPVSTIVAHATLTVIAVISLTSKKNPFRISLKNCSFSKPFLGPLFNLSVPVFFEKFTFNFGKVIVNSMCASFGSIVIGALGVSNRLGGLVTNPMNGFQEAESSLMSQNIGAKNVKRALGIFYTTLSINLIFATCSFIITTILKEPIIAAFAKGSAEFAGEIEKIYMFERMDALLMAVNISVMGLLYSFGKTRVSMAINIIRLFGFRIPPLLIFMNVPYLRQHLGTMAVGIAMLMSNALSGIIAGITAIIFIRKLKRQGTV